MGLAGGRGRGSLHFRLLHAMPAEPRHAPPNKTQLLRHDIAQHGTARRRHAAKKSTPTFSRQ